MRYFLDNILRLQPQNLIPEAIWLGWILYALVMLACFQDLWFLKTSWVKRTAWTLVVCFPFLGALVYAVFCVVTADSSFKELLRSNQQSDGS
mgnify:CR=1 FL=1